MTRHVCTAFLNTSTLCSSKLILSSGLLPLMLLLFMLQHSIPMHINLSLFFTALSNFNTHCRAQCNPTNVFLQVEQFPHPTPVVLVPLVCCLHSSHYCANSSLLSQTPHLLSDCFTENSLFTNYLSNYSSHQVEHFPSLCCPAFSLCYLQMFFSSCTHTLVVNQVSPTFHFFNLQALLIRSA